jgi:hypothetical protein
MKASQLKKPDPPSGEVSHQGGNPPHRKSIHLFDLDDTLITTSARVFVRDGKEAEILSLTPDEFTSHRLAVGHRYDFREFSDVGILSRGIVVEYTRGIIETLVKRGTQSAFGILTARGDKHLHAPFLIRLFKGLFGIALRKSLIFTLSDVRYAAFREGKELPEPFHGKRWDSLSIPEKKAAILLAEVAGRGFNDISFYDDSRDNLDVFKTAKALVPGVKYRPHFIDPTWTVRLNEFRNGDAPRLLLVRGRISACLIWKHHGRTYSGRKKMEFEDVQKALEGGEPVILKGGDLGLELSDGRWWVIRIL